MFYSRLSTLYVIVAKIAQICKCLLIQHDFLDIIYGNRLLVIVCLTSVIYINVFPKTKASYFLVQLELIRLIAFRKPLVAAARVSHRIDSVIRNFVHASMSAQV